jgi:hypothetical protein
VRGKRAALSAGGEKIRVSAKKLYSGASQHNPAKYFSISWATPTHPVGAVLEIFLVKKEM